VGVSFLLVNYYLLRNIDDLEQGVFYIVINEQSALNLNKLVLSCRLLKVDNENLRLNLQLIQID